MASEGEHATTDAAAQAPQWTHRGVPSAFFAQAWSPLKPAIEGLFSVGYCLVTAWEKSLLRVRAIPFRISTKKIL
jgi:hypothetical protein